ncbi:hypothetical protein JMJ77_0007473 [Colletotrichum scovillei]|uniref:Uncharacterized protein n=1 Tax=Colletotrichum scovillei TaxID=1209932 RepID=A0A9P7RF45_9PEZI|nr:hypothetical protein JMJ77_0007473 [Colletotrichum scovillei]KAG7074476.1 hypothetical protein JMJ76_0010954 [Colletotrichum scovillei]KAG7081396.1 hypothetical protein JMJ78_0003519 [Colletotrichum scovillei]
MITHLHDDFNQQQAAATTTTTNHPRVKASELCIAVSPGLSLLLAYPRLAWSHLIHVRHHHDSQLKTSR